LLNSQTNGTHIVEDNGLVEVSMESMMMEASDLPSDTNTYFGDFVPNS